MPGRVTIVAACMVCCSVFYLALQAQPHCLPLFSAHCNAVRSWLASAVFEIQSLRLVDMRLFLICYDVWCLARSMVTSLRLTGSSLNLFYIKSAVPPANDRQVLDNLHKPMQPYYKVFLVVFWILSWWFTVHFVLSFFRAVVDGDENWTDCNNWTDVPVTWPYDFEYLTMDVNRRRPAVRRRLASRRRRTATTRRLRTKYPLSEYVKKIF